MYTPRLCNSFESLQYTNCLNWFIWLPDIAQMIQLGNQYFDRSCIHCMSVTCDHLYKCVCVHCVVNCSLIG